MFWTRRWSEQRFTPTRSESFETLLERKLSNPSTLRRSRQSLRRTKMRTRGRPKTKILSETIEAGSEVDTVESFTSSGSDLSHELPMTVKGMGQGQSQSKSKKVWKPQVIEAKTGKPKGKVTW